MNRILITLIVFCGVALQSFAASPAFGDFVGTQFDTNGNKVRLSSLVTNAWRVDATNASAAVSNALYGSKIDTTNGFGLNTVSTNITVQGIARFAQPTNIYGSGGPLITINGGGAGTYGLDGIGGVVRFKGGPGGGYLTDGGTLVNATWGTGIGRDAVFRINNSNASYYITSLDGRDVPLGVGVTSYDPFPGGSSAALSDTPPHGPEIWKNAPIPSLVIVAFSNSLVQNEAFFTNTMNGLVANGALAVWTNQGIPVSFALDNAVQAPHRTNGHIALNPALWNMSLTNLANYCHSNNVRLRFAQYWSAVIPTNGNSEVDVNVSGGQTEVQYPVNTPPANYIPATTPDRVRTDMMDFYWAGVDELRVADLVVFSGYHLMSTRMFSYAALYPRGGVATWRTQFPNRRYAMVLEYLVGDVRDMQDAMPFEGNSFALDQPIGNSNPGQRVKGMMDLAKYWTTNYLWALGPGHLPSWNAQTDMSLSESETKAQVTLYSVFPMSPNISPDISTNGNLRIQYMTNSEVNAVFTTPSPMANWVVTNGEQNVFARTLPDGSYAVAVFNETAGTVSQLVTASQLGFPSNVVFSVRDLWLKSTVGTFSGSFTFTNQPAESAGFYRLIPAADKSVRTNFISGQLYVNSYGGAIGVSTKAALTMAIVSGDAALHLEIYGTETNASAEATTTLTLVGVKTNVLSGIVPAGVSYSFTNKSSGAGNSAFPVGGQIIIY